MLILMKGISDAYYKHLTDEELNSKLNKFIIFFHENKILEFNV